jgi:hypothetical protein
MISVACATLCGVAWVASVFRSDSLVLNTAEHTYMIFSGNQRMGFTVGDPWPGRPAFWHRVSFDRYPAGRPWWGFFNSRPARTAQAPWASPTALFVLASGMSWIARRRRQRSSAASFEAVQRDAESAAGVA